jgi:hypothetical protein
VAVLLVDGSSATPERIPCPQTRPIRPSRAFVGNASRRSLSRKAAARRPAGWKLGSRTELGPFGQKAIPGRDLLEPRPERLLALAVIGLGRGAFGLVSADIGAGRRLERSDRGGRQPLPGDSRAVGDGGDRHRGHQPVEGETLEAPCVSGEAGSGHESGVARERLDSRRKAAGQGVDEIDHRQLAGRVRSASIVHAVRRTKRGSGCEAVGLPPARRGNQA